MTEDEGNQDENGEDGEDDGEKGENEKPGQEEPEEDEAVNKDKLFWPEGTWAAQGRIESSDGAFQMEVVINGLVEDPSPRWEGLLMGTVNVRISVGWMEAKYTAKTSGRIESVGEYTHEEMVLNLDKNDEEGLSVSNMRIRFESSGEESKERRGRIESVNRVSLNAKQEATDSMMKNDPVPLKNFEHYLEGATIIFYLEN